MVSPSVTRITWASKEICPNTGNVRKKKKNNGAKNELGPKARFFTDNLDSIWPKKRSKEMVFGKIVTVVLLNSEKLILRTTFAIQPRD